MVLESPLPNDLFWNFFSPLLLPSRLWTVNDSVMRLSDFILLIRGENDGDVTCGFIVTDFLTLWRDFCDVSDSLPLPNLDLMPSIFNPFSFRGLPATGRGVKTWTLTSGENDTCLNSSESILSSSSSSEYESSILTFSMICLVVVIWTFGT